MTHGAVQVFQKPHPHRRLVVPELLGLHINSNDALDLHALKQFAGPAKHKQEENFKQEQSVQGTASLESNTMGQAWDCFCCGLIIFMIASHRNNDLLSSLLFTTWTSNNLVPVAKV